jgi:uncharacterized protein YkwD
MRPMLPIVFSTLVVLGSFPNPLACSHAQQEKPKDSGGSSPSRASADTTLDDLLAAHNKVRAEQKLPPLRLNSRLNDAARGHARDMAEHTKLTHEGSDGSDIKTRIKRTEYHYQEISENVAAGQDSVGEAMNTWLESPPHRENILGNFTEVGGAVVRGSDGQNYWCVDFGRPMLAVDPARSPGELIKALNKVRAEAKKKPLKSDPRLSRVAAQFARLAADRKSLESRDREGNSPFDVLASEGFRPRRFGMTLAEGEGDPAKVVASCIKEPRDRAALLSSFESAGVGVFTDPDGVPYWVILLAQGMSP